MTLSFNKTMNEIPFQTIDWNKIVKTKHPGTSGIAYSQTLQLGGLRIRKVSYSENYIADHWCQKGHIVHCLEGNFRTEFENGQKVELTKGMSFIVSDNLSSHRSVSNTYTELLIIDGDFLN